MSKIVSTPPSTAIQKGALGAGKDGEAAGGAGMFAGIFTLLNTQASGEDGAGELGLPELSLPELSLPELSLQESSLLGEEGTESQERAPEETAALLAAMLPPTPEVAAGTAKIAGQNAQGKKPVLATLAEDLAAPQGGRMPAGNGLGEDVNAAADRLKGAFAHNKPGAEMLEEGQTARTSQQAAKIGEKDSLSARQPELILKKPEQVIRQAGQVKGDKAALEGSQIKTADTAQGVTASQLKAERAADAMEEQAELLPAKANSQERISGQTRLSTGQEASQSLNIQSQMSGNNSQGGQQGGANTSAGAGFDNSIEQWADMLDMQDDNWSEMLVRRIDKEFRGGGKGLEIEMSPRHLGRLNITLSQQQEQTHIQMRTENSAAAQMLAEAESRLAQMLENSGLKLGMFNTFTGGDGRQAGQNNNGNDGQKNGAGNTSEAGADDSGGPESANAENDETRVNITA